MFAAFCITLISKLNCVSVCVISDGKEYALKLIEGTGISMSACREIAVRFSVSCTTLCFNVYLIMHAITQSTCVSE